jgi:putative Ca2+/H+ antiporter (TMEM165/GDT1 family)
MQWQLFASTFAAIFLAEMGDKTQIAALVLSGSSSARWSVFLGAATALVATTAIAVIAGAAIGRYIPVVWLKRGAGAVFIVMGVSFLLTRPAAPATPAAGPGDTPGAASGPPL